MAINKKLISVATQAQFAAQLSAGNIDNRSIVFIEDKKRIWTHGVYFDTSWEFVTGKPGTYTPSAHTLGSHSDVTITSNTSGEVLKWNGTNWINNTLTEANIASLTDLNNYLLISEFSKYKKIRNITTQQEFIDALADQSEYVKNLYVTATIFIHSNTVFEVYGSISITGQIHFRISGDYSITFQDSTYNYPYISLSDPFNGATMYFNTSDGMPHNVTLYIKDDTIFQTAVISSNKINTTVITVGDYTPPLTYGNYVSPSGSILSGNIQQVNMIAQKSELVTTSQNGIMSAADKSKLDGISAGAKTGTVTSVAMTVPTGLSVSGTPITTSGTLALSLTSGYSIPTTAKQSNWDAAYSHSNSSHAYLPLSGGTLTGNLGSGENTMMSIGHNVDLALVKKSGAGGFIGVGLNRSFIVARSNNAAISVGDTFTPLLTINGNDSTFNGSVTATSFIGSNLHVTDTSAGAETLPLIIQNASSSTNTKVGVKFVPSQGTSRYSAIEGIQEDGNNLIGLGFVTGTGSTITEKMRIKSNGNVGIGTTSPAYKLDVSGTGRFTGDVTAPTFIGELSGNASSATALTTLNVGSSTNPIYFSSGKPVASTYSFGNASGNIPISNGTLNTNLNADLLDGNQGSYYTSYTDTAIDGIEIGGRNLLLNTKNERSGVYNMTSTYILAEKPIVGESYTLSGWFKFPEGKLKRIMAYNSGGSVGLFSRTDSAWPYEEWFYFNITFTWKNEAGSYSANDTSVNVYCGASDGLLSYAKLIKLEKGNKATDWSPAPEDQVSDWNENNATSFSYIKNKPTQLSQFTDNIGVATHIANTSNPHAVTTSQIGAVDLTTNQSIGGIKSFTNRVYFNYGQKINTPISYAWTGATINTNSIEIQNNYGADNDSSPTLAFHHYGYGGPQFRLDNKVLWLESASANSARQNIPGGSTYFKSLNLTSSDVNGIYINNHTVYHAGNIPTWNQNTTGNAATASAVSTSAENTGTTSRYILFADNASGNQALKTDTGLKYVPSTNTISANISGNLSGGTVNGTALGVTNVSASTGLGLSLYGGPTAGIPQYGIAFAGTPTFGTHGAVTGDWATYLTMTGATSRGWIFKLGTTNVASISATGVVTATTFSGDLTGNVTGNITGNVTGNVSGSAGSTTNWAGNTYDNSNITNEVYLMTSTNGTYWRRTLANRYVDTTSNQSIGGVKSFEELSLESNSRAYLRLYYQKKSNWPDYNSYITNTGAADEAGTRGLVINANVGQIVTNYGINLAISDISRVFIQHTGNVGIGITNPTEKLDVSGNIKASGTITSAGGTISSTLKSTGMFVFEPGSTSNFTEGARFNLSTSGWAGMVIGGDRGSVSGNTTSWWVARNTTSNFVITYGTSSGSGGLELPSSGNDIKWRNQLIYHAGNFANGTTAQYIRGDGSLATYSDTTYSLMTAAEASTGTATTARTISAKVLADEINRRSDLRYLPLTGGTLGNTAKLEITNNSVGISNVLQLTNISPSGRQGTSIFFKGYFNQALISSSQIPSSIQGGDLHLQTYSSDSVLNTGIYLDRTGKVGINTITPSYNLDVAGTGRFSSTLSVTGILTGGDEIIAGTGKGFRNAGYQAGFNPIWSFNTAETYGLGYYQGAHGLAGVTGDAVGFHFGSTAAPKVTIDSSGKVVATTFVGALTGNASSATYASTVTLTADNATNATRYPLFASAATGNLSPLTDTGFTYNPSTGALTATSFVGNLSGNASSATQLASINTTFTGTYPVAFNVNGTIYSHTGITYTGSTNTLTTSNFVGSGASLTSLNATQLTSGTVPNSVLSGTYDGISLRLINGNTVSMVGTVTRSGMLLASRGFWGAVTGAIVFIAPYSLGSQMNQFEISGFNYSPRKAYKYILSNYNYTATTPGHLLHKISLGSNDDISVRVGRTSSGNWCIILGDESTTWQYPQFELTKVMGGNVAESNVIGWTTDIVTDLSTYTNITNPTYNAGIATDIYGNAATATKLGTATIGGTVKPFYLNAGTPTAFSTTVGGTSKGVYMSSGSITAMSATVGSSTAPVYMNAGTITACGTSLGVSITGNANSADKVNNKLTLKFDTGPTENTDLYTYDGSAAKTINIKAGSNVSLTKTANTITINSTDTNTTYSAGTKELLLSGIDTTNRVWSGKTLKDWYLEEIDILLASDRFTGSTFSSNVIDLTNVNGAFNVNSVNTYTTYTLSNNKVRGAWAKVLVNSSMPITIPGVKLINLGSIFEVNTNMYLNVMYDGINTLGYYTKVVGSITPSYYINTSSTVVIFTNTPISNFCDSSSSIIINGVYVSKNVIKDICLSGDYSNITTIEEGFLSGCTSLTSVDLSSMISVTYIDLGFLSGCTSLTSVDLSSMTNVTYIGWGFLNGCTSLTSVDLSAMTNVTYIDDYFLTGSGVNTLKMGAIVPPSLLWALPSSLTSILVPSAAVNAYKSAPYWSQKASIISGY